LEPPTEDHLEHTDDHVYENTTNVVRSVMALTKLAPSVKPDEYVDFVKVIFLSFLSVIQQ